MRMPCRLPHFVSGSKEIAKQIKDQQKAIYRQAKIKLNIARATERAQLIVARETARQAALQAKSILKLSTIAGLANSKDATSKQLLQIAQDAKNKIQAIKDQLALDKATTTDKTIHAQQTKTANDKILTIQQQAQEDAEKIKQQAVQQVVGIQDNVAQQSAEPPINDTAGLVAAQATQLVDDAIATAQVEGLAPN